MKISRTAALAPIALLAGAAAFVFLKPTPADPNPKAARAAAALPAGHPLAAPASKQASAEMAGAAIAELQQQVARLEAETAELRLRLPGTSAAAPAVAGAAQAGRAAERPNPRPDPAEIEAADRALAETRETAFRNEALDARWSVSTAATLQQALGTGDAAAPPVRSLECRSRTCRVEIDPAQPAQIDNLMPEIANRLAGTLTSIAASHIDAGDGSRSMVLYLSR